MFQTANSQADYTVPVSGSTWYVPPTSIWGPCVAPVLNTASILFVPDLSASSKEAETLKSSWALLRRYIPADTRLRVFGFEYCIVPNTEGVWDAVRLEAKELVECLCRQIDSISHATSSLIIFCHGLGGILVKEALANIYNSHQTASHRKIRDFHRGTVLFGTPHPTNDRPDTELEVVRVAKISQNFQERLREKPVVSLVDSGFAETGVPDEKLVELDADHFGLLGCPKDEEMLRTIKNIIQNAMKWASTKQLSTSSPQYSSSNDDSADSINDVLSDDSWQHESTDQVEGEKAAFGSHFPQPNLQLLTDSVLDVHDDQLENDEYISLVDRSRAEITALSELSPDHRSLVVPYSMLKPSERNPQFFGRQELLSQIDHALLPVNGSVAGQSLYREFAICGLGGMGKTELAREFTFSRQEKFDAISLVHYFPPHFHPCILGIIHRCIAFVRKHQGLAKESFDAYLEAMRHFRGTVGDKSHYVAQMCSNLGAYHMTKKEYETASMYLEKAVMGYRAHSCYKAQLALALFRTGNLQEATGDIDGAKKSLAEVKELHLAASKSGEMEVELTEERLLATLPLSSHNHPFTFPDKFLTELRDKSGLPLLPSSYNNASVIHYAQSEFDTDVMVLSAIAVFTLVRAMVDGGLYEKAPVPNAMLAQHLVPDFAGTVAIQVLVTADSMRIRA
ncbi:hypothetical protein B0T17DRAFT_646451 [Bombardia bombarda]|uniref:GPI inositol-deacylase n=1 Tax=Bombardia bombarda TaxID=252184 RepID=A0AA39WGR3_9PEZI|nr:hypothetical protein B0T17DRAFT_646451 [Bombardia bombarda]